MTGFYTVPRPNSRYPPPTPFARLDVTLHGILGDERRARDAAAVRTQGLGAARAGAQGAGTAAAETLPASMFINGGLFHLDQKNPGLVPTKTASQAAAGDSSSSSDSGGVAPQKAKSSRESKKKVSSWSGWAPVRATKLSSGDKAKRMVGPSKKPKSASK
jgi:hypothetical protein